MFMPPPPKTYVHILQYESCIMKISFLHNDMSLPFLKVQLQRKSLLTYISMFHKWSALSKKKLAETPRYLSSTDKDNDTANHTNSSPCVERPQDLPERVTLGYFKVWSKLSLAANQGSLVRCAFLLRSAHLAKS